MRAGQGTEICGANVPIRNFSAFHPNTLVLRRREAASKDAPARAGPGAAFWNILRDARLRLAPQDEGVGSPRQSTFTVNRTNFESGTLARSGRRRGEHRPKFQPTATAPVAQALPLPSGTPRVQRETNGPRKARWADG